MEKSETPPNKIWIITAIIFVAIVLVVIIVYAMLSASGKITTPDATQPPAFITITEPVQGANLDLTWAVKVEGEAGGLFEGNVVVQALDAAGNILVQEPTIINTSDAGTGGSGPWSVSLNIIAPIGSQGEIVAFSTSPVDGSWLAEDRVVVGYGEAPFKKDLLKIEDHLWRLVTLNERPPIQDTFLTLQFEPFRAAGFGGCNNFQTSFKRSGTALNFGFVTSTAKECEIPVGIMAQESAYFSALEQITNYQIEEKQFILVDNSGVERLVYDAVVMGNIIGPDDIQMPENAVIFVKLIDSSMVGTDFELIAEQTTNGVSQFPTPFSLNYNPRQIIDDNTYVVEVHIEDGSGNLLFTNPGIYPVITGGNPSLVNINLEKVQ